MRNKRGIARKNFRADGGRVWKPATRKKEAAPEATEARRRMIEREEAHPDMGRDKANRRAYPKHE